MKRWLLLSIIFLIGCSYGLAGDDLLALPRTSPDVDRLHAQLNTLLSSEDGAIVAPNAGSNRQPIQVRDLTGNGRDNFIVFYRTEADYPIRIAIFEPYNETFVLQHTLQLPGEDLVSVAFANLFYDDGLEMIIGTESNDVKLLTVFRNFEEVLTTEYTAVIIHTVNNRDYLLTVVGNIHAETQQYNNSVRLYLPDEESGHLARSDLVTISPGQYRSVRFTSLHDATPAILITTTEGLPDINETAVTDVLVLSPDHQRIDAISLDIMYGRSPVRNANMPVADLTNNGKKLFPVTLSSSAGGAADVVQWISYTSYGERIPQLQTVHNLNDGWQFTIPDTWGDIVLFQHEVTRERHIVLAVQDVDNPEIFHDILSIIRVVGGARELPERPRFTLLSNQVDLIVAELFELPEGLEAFYINAEDVQNAMSWIVRDMLPLDLND